MKKIKIMQKLYVRAESFTSNYWSMTPYYDDRTSKKKIEKLPKIKHVDKMKSPLIEVQNTPIGGFRATGGSDYMTVHDPRGFHIAISVENFSKLMSHATIINGIIADNCVWVTFDTGGHGILSTSHPYYKDASEFTEIMTSSESWTNVKPGYKVRLTTGYEGIFLGRYYLIRQEGWFQNRKIEISKNKSAIFKSTNPTKRPATDPRFGLPEIQMLGSPRVSSILAQDEIEYKDAEKEVNDLLAEAGDRSVIGVSSANIGLTNIKFNLVPVEEPTLAEMLEEPIALFVRTSNQFGEIYKSHRSTDIYTYVESDLADSKLTKITKPGTSRWGSGYSDDSRAYLQTDDDKHFRLSLEFSTKLGNTFNSIVKK
jgi:hypothetical protein